MSRPGKSVTKISVVVSLKRGYSRTFKDTTENWEKMQECRTHCIHRCASASPVFWDLGPPDILLNPAVLLRPYTS